MEWTCSKHDTESLGFAFLCFHLASGVGKGFHTIPDDEDEHELRPAVLCDSCEAERQRSGGFRSSRVCGARYDEVKAQRLSRSDPIVNE
jgi:hypothetical protein